MQICLTLSYANPIKRPTELRAKAEYAPELNPTEVQWKSFKRGYQTRNLVGGISVKPVYVSLNCLTLGNLDRAISLI